MNNNLWEERINFYSELKDITIDEINEMNFKSESDVHFVSSPNKNYRLTKPIQRYKEEIKVAVRNTDGYHKKADVLRDYLKEADGKKQSLIKNIDNYKHPNNFDWWEFNDANLQIHLIDSLISHIRSILKNNEIDEIRKDKSLNLSSIFNDKNNAYEVLKGLLEDLQITIVGQPQIKAGRVGKLTGLITAIKETPGMLKLEKPSNDQLLKYFNEHLKTNYKTFSKRNEEYNQSIDDAKRYIKNHFKK